MQAWATNRLADVVKGNGHAEVRACKKATKVKGSTVIVMRIMADDTMGFSKPCPKCQTFMRNCGVKKVVYSIDATTFGVLKL